jgi:hypothetical protein
MRALTPLGPFRETGEEEYAHTPFSEIYMVPQMNAIFKVMCVIKPSYCVFHSESMLSD